MNGNTTGGTPGNGGAIHQTSAADLTILGGMIDANIADQEGGGLWVSSSGIASISGTNFVDNTASGPAADQGGGGIFNNGGTVSITMGTIEGNMANGLSGSGGGILNSFGVMSITRTMFIDNSASRAGGGIEISSATMEMNEVTVMGNTTGDNPGNGGGIHHTGSSTLTFNGGAIEGNTAAAEGGGLWVTTTGIATLTGTMITGNTANGDGTEQGGGGVFNDGGIANITDAIVEMNSSTATSVGSGGGGIFNDGTMNLADTAVRGNMANTGTANGGGILNSDGGTLTVSGGSITENQGARAGGGIENNAGMVTLNEVQLDDNTTGINGGGLHISGAGTAMINGGTASGNEAGNEGGGLWNSSNASATIELAGTTIDGNTAEFGGGIFNDGAAGTYTITRSTVSNNVANMAGGGLDIEGGVVNIINSTLSGNRVNIGSGGGMNADAGSSVRLVHTTIVGNRAAANGGGVVSADIVIGNTLIANNVAGGIGPDIVGTLESLDFNLIGDSSDGTLNGPTVNTITNTAALVSGLSDNGGPTLTHRLMAGSPAIDAADGNLSVSEGLATDQRGFARISNIPGIPNADNGVDIGAVEIIGLMINDGSGNEDSGSIPFNLSLSHDISSGENVSFRVDTADVPGEAVGGTDYTKVVGQILSFAPAGALTQVLSIDITADPDPEPNETFEVVLSNAINATILDNTGLGTILDDDGSLRNFDVQPMPVDDFVDALDLIEWLERIGSDTESRDLVLEFSLFWHENQ